MYLGQENIALLTVSLCAVTKLKHPTYVIVHQHFPYK